MEGWHWERMKYERCEMIILRIFLYTINTKLEVAVHILRRRTEVEVRVGKLVNGKGFCARPGLESNPRHKNLCGRREPSDYVSFRKAVKR